MAKNLDLSEFGGAPQLDLSEFEQPAAPPASTARRAADVGLALGRGIVAVPEAAVGISNLVTGGRSGKAVEQLGVRFKDAKQVLTDFQSDEQKAADAQVQQADGFFPTLGAMVRNPSTIANAAAESVPSMLAGGAGSQALVAKGVGGVTAGAAGEAAVSAGSTAEQVRQESATGFLTGKQAALAATSGAVTGVINRASGRLAEKLGIADVNTAMATGKLGGATNKGLPRRMGEGALNEGVLQELPQSMQEQAMQNLALDKPVGEGVAQAGAAGMLVGGLTGTGFAAVSGSPAAPAVNTEDPSVGRAPPPPPPPPAQGGVSADPSPGVFSNGEVQNAPPANPPAAPPVSKAQAMGINPAAGPLQAAAGVTVDSGADVITQEQEIQKQEAEAKAKEDAKPGPDGKKPAPQPPAPVQPPAADPAVPITGPFTQAIHGARNVPPPPAPVVDPQGLAAAPAAAGAAADPAAAQGARADQGPQGAGPVPAAVPEPVQAAQPVTPPPTQESTNANQQARSGESIDPETGEILQWGAQGASGDGIQRPADALQPGADAKGPQPAAGQPAAPSGAGTSAQGQPAASVESVAARTRKERWLKNVADAHRLNGPTGVQIGGLVNGRVNILGNPDATKQGRNLRDSIDEAINAGATPQEIVDAALKRPDERAPAPPKPPAPATPVDMGAHTAATSPLNDRPEPTQAQKDAGNYKKAHIVLGGLEISIENPEGSTRSGVDADGKPWSNTMTGHYGYIKRTTGSDGEQQDVYLKPGTPLDYAGPVFVVDQIDPKTGKHDEFKSMVGYKSPMEARKAYMSNYAKDWNGLKSVQAMTWDEFKAWVKTGKQPAAPEIPQSAPAPVQPPAPASGSAGPGAEAQKTEESVSPAAAPPAPSGQEVRGADQIESSQASPDGTPAQPAGKVVSTFYGKFGKGMAMGNAQMKAANLNKSADDRDRVTYTAEEHGDPKMDNPWAVVGRETKPAAPEPVPAQAKKPATPQIPPPLPPSSYSTGKGPTVIINKLGKDGLTDSERAAGKKPYNDAPAKERWEGYEIVDSPRAGKKMVREPRGDGSYQNLAEFTPGRGSITHFFEAPSTRTPIEKAINRWAEQQKPAAPTSKPEIVVDKAEIRPYRKPDGSIGYEAVPIQPPKPVVEPTPKAKPVASANTIFTEDAAAAARARLKAKLGRLNSGLDPETMLDGITLAGYHIEKGARTFAAYAKAMLEDLGDGVKPYLKSWYMGVRYDPRAAGFDGMSTAAEVDAASLDTLETPQEKADTAPNGSSDDATDSQPGVGQRDPGAVQGAAGGRGTPAQQPAAPDNSGNVEAPQPTDAPEPAGPATADTTGVRAPGPDVGPGAGTAGPGDAGDGRPGTGRKGKPAAGARGRRAAGPDSPVKAPESVSPANPGPGDFSIDDPLKIIGGGQVARFDKNKAAIELRNRLMDEGRMPTREEQTILAGYTGWGSFGQELFQGSWAKPAPKSGWEARDKWLRENLGQKEWEGMQTSIINAHYTDPPTVLTMWDMVRRMGFTGGRVLEPSIGIGNFFGMMPAELVGRSKRAGIELDPVTGSMAQMLYPNANIQIKGYEASTTPDNFYDLVIGNWPFFEHGPADRRYNRLSPTLHDYFFLKAIDQTRPGGLVVGITSKGTMDKKGIGARLEMARKAELVAAFRLPSGAFEEYAGTKVVTDIIILRKRKAPMGIVAKEGWIETLDHPTREGTPVAINEYYHRNPSHVIGEIDFGHGTTTFGPGLIVRRPDDMMEQLRRIVDLVPEGAFLADQTAKHISYVANHTKDRTNSLVDTPQGLFVVHGEHMAPAGEILKYELKDPKATQKRVDELKALVKMRQLYAELIDAERGDKGADTQRKTLRQAYEAFTKANGPMSKSFGLQYLRKLDDPFYPSLAALEIGTLGADGKMAYRPAKILTESTMRGARAIENPSITDAFVLARNESVNPPIARIAEISGKPEAEVRQMLVDSGAGFEMPNGDFAPADVYLSGNVRAKLREAKAAVEAGNKAVQRNVEALQQVVPADIPYYKIETQMGATWVPPSTYAEFVGHMLGIQEGIEVGFQAGAWKIDFPSAYNHRAEATSGFGTTHVKFKRLVRAAIANQSITVKVKDSDGVEHVMEEATKEVNAKIADMRLKFGEWLWSDPVRRTALEAEYNEVRNAYADPKFDGSFLGFQGMALTLGRGPFNLREHQVNAIWRGLVTRKSLNAHEVGTGKTFTMGGIAVESRRYGIAKKPMLFAHNANSKSVAHEIQSMYPAAKVLYVDNLSKENLKTRMMQIANDDWDVIVMPHSIIDRIGFKEETLMAMAQEELNDLETAANEAADEEGVSISDAMWDDEEELKKLRSVTAKQLVKQRLTILTTIRKLAQQASKDDSVAFEDMGVDMLLVDEAHEFKKPPIATKMKLKGLQTQTSNRSIALMFLTKYVRANNNGANVHLFTGTPITNTMTEVFHMMRYMMQEEMKEVALADWDGWFGSFAREVNDVELTSTGEYEAVTRLQSFINVPELRRMIGQYMDVVFSDEMPEMRPRSINGKVFSDPTLTEAERAQLLNGRTEGAADRPYKKVVNESSDMSPEQQSVFAQVQRYAATWKNMSKKDRKTAMSQGAPESPLIHDGIASKASFDVRLVQAIANAGKEGSPAMEPHPDSKAARTIKNLLEVYRGHPQANQVVFMSQGMAKTVTRREGPMGMKRDVTYPAFSTMHDMIERLVAAGVPRDQIAAVDGATSKDRRKEIADAMNTGQIRIVFGSTGSLGVGVNMQRNLRAMHHMDAPWMPGDLEQRNGRGHRQGNQWNTVLEFRYITDRLDGKRWQTLARKQKFITDFMKAKGDVRVIEGDVASEDEGDILSTFAEAAGDPRILLREKLKKTLEGLQSRERMHGIAQSDAARTIKAEQRDIESMGQALTAAGPVVQSLSQLIEQQRGDGFTMTVKGKQYTKRTDAVEALDKVAADMRTGDEVAVIGAYGPLQLYAQWYRFADAPFMGVSIPGSKLDVNANGMSLASLESGLRHRRDTEIPHLEAQIARAKERMEHARKVLAEPFHMADKLAKTRKQLEDMERDIEANPVAPPYWLRNGAPIDTEVYRGGQPFTVIGHRWSDQGWFVVGSDDKGEVNIPYMQAMDAQGMPLYEEHEFSAPTLANQPGWYLVTDDKGNLDPVPRKLSANDIKDLLAHNHKIERAAPPVDLPTDSSFSRSAPASSGLPAQKVRLMAAPFAKRLHIDLRVVDTPAELPVPAPADAAGLYHNGTIWLVASNIRTREDIAQAVAHEAVAHLGLRQLLEPAEYRQLMTMINAGAASSGRLAEIRAYIRRIYVDQSGKFNLTPVQEADEIAARVAELGVDADGNFRPGFEWLKAIFAKVVQWLRSKGLDIPFTNAELQGMLVRAQTMLERGPESTGQMGAAFARRSDRADVRRMNENQVEREIRVLMPRVERAYEIGDLALAERLDARLETLMEAMENNLLEMQEDTLDKAYNEFNRAVLEKEGQQGDIEDDLVIDLANRWLQITKPGSYEAKEYSTDAERAATLRALLSDYEHRHGGLKEGLSDEAIIEAAKDAVQSVYKMREARRARAQLRQTGTAFSRGGQQSGTEEQARAAGFTMKAYRGISKANPFNDSGTTWLTTNREVAEAYAEEVMGYEDPDVITVMVKPDGLPRHDASRLSDQEREQLRADRFGNPQALGIYDRSDDHPLGGSRKNVTVIHAPREAVFVVQDGRPESLTPYRSDNTTPEQRAAQLAAMADAGDAAAAAARAEQAAARATADGQTPIPDWMRATQFSRRPGYFFDARQSPLYKTRTAEQAGAITQEQASQALQTDAVARRILAKGVTVQEGELVGARLNINVFKNTGVPVNTVHRGNKGQGYTQNRGLWGGEVITYAPVVTLRDAYFNVGQKAREAIASGSEAKSPMASIDGKFHVEHSFDGVEFRFNPKREHLFRDGLGRVLRHADEVTISGSSAYARGEIEYYGPEDVPARAGDAPTQGRLMEPGNDDGTPLFMRKPDMGAAAQRAGNTAAHYRGLGLQALGRRQITELYGNILPQLPIYSRLMAQMDADKNEAGAEADQIAKDWGKLKDERQLAEVMHDATLAQMDPEKPLVRGDDPLTYDRLRAQFAALSPEAKAVYVAARDTYRTHHENVRKAIRDRIERSEMRGQRKAELLKQMDDEFYQSIKGVYFPLARFGDYVVIVRDPTGKVLSVNRAESINEAEALQASLRKAYPDMTVGKVLKSKEFNAGRDAVGRGFMQNLYEALGKADMDEKERADLEDMLGQLYLSALPDLSWAKHGIHRKGTPGFSQDARRAFAQNTFHGARYLAKVRYSDLLENELLDAQKQVDALSESDSFDSVKAQQVIDEMVKRHDAAMNPDSNALSTALTSVGFVFHLGLSPASALVNLTQTALVAYPIMGAKWGWGKASAALLKASQQAAANRNDISSMLSTEEKRAYDEAVRSGVIDVTMAHDLAGISQGEDAKVAWKLRPVMRWASFLFHHAEKFNRQVTFVASYRLAREAGTPMAQAYEQAVKATYDGHFDYSASNRPRLMQGNVARVLLLFKQYGQNMVYTLSRQAYLSMKGASPYERAQARKALGGLLAMHAAAAGVLGLPMVSTLLAAASFLGGDDDEPWDAEVALRNMLADAMGDQAADVLARGLSRLTPWDISGRVGLDKLILPDIQEGLEGQDLANSVMAAALGPVAGIGVSLLRGMQEISDGNWARGLEAMAPSLARGPLKALRYGTEGAIDKTGKPIVEDVGAAGVVGQALGFSPSEVRLATEAKSAVHQADQRLNKRRALLLRQYSMAVIMGDADGAADARQDILAFNEKNPQRRINPLQMARSVATRKKQIALSEGGVYLPKSHKDAMQAGQFGMP